MKRFALVLSALFLFSGTAILTAQTVPTLDTDKVTYQPGEPITFTGSNWEPGEPVAIVISPDGAVEETILRVTANDSGSFTVTGTLPDANASSSGHSIMTNGGRTVAPSAAENANYHATATGGISHATAQAQFNEGEPETDGARLLQAEDYWFNRLTFPTGKFNPGWVRNAAKQDKNVPRGTPKGKKKGHSGLTPVVANFGGNISILTLTDTGFTALGPKPERMTGCTGCFDYTTTAGRINSIAIDPTTTTNGSIVAYAGSVGGGVWKTTNCCSNATSWTVVTDDPLVATTNIDTVTIDPNDHNTIYAGTGDLNYGSFSMGSQGILKSTDAGATWTVLGADVFGAALPEPVDRFPQYQAVGKVRVDPNDSNRVVAGTKLGLYLSYDGGNNWTGPCITNNFPAQRQDITALELSNISGTTRIVAAVGVRGFATTVQFNLDQNGANGIYKATMPSSGCPGFTSIAGNANGFVNGASNANAGSGVPFVNSTTGNQLGRIDIGVAPSNPNVIYAQVQSITPNSNSGGASGGCAGAAGCQLGAWVTINGGTTWTFMTGSAGNSLLACASSGTGSSGAGDYPQNWYDQGVAVDPNNPDRVFFDTYEVWMATRTGTAWYDVTCGYAGSNPHPVHVDQHALAFVPGSSSLLVLGNDGGMHATLNANAAALNTLRPTWFNLDTGLNTIEFYSGDISGNFANSATPQASGGAQDNGPSSVLLNGSNIAAAQWQMGLGGDGFFSRIDPVGTGTSLRFWQGNNSGGVSRCIGVTSGGVTAPCTNGGATWTSKRGAWTGDQQSFILPFDLFHGDPGNPANDCGAPGAGTGCGHLIAGTVRVWETITGAAANTGGTVTWYVNSPANLTKGAAGTLGNRAFINQLTFEPKLQSTVIVGTNDANVQIGRGLGTGSNQSTWVNVTGGNTVLPNRPVLDVAFDPTTTTAPIGYAAVGGFNANTPLTPGHVFRVVCNTNCASFTWSDRSGNLPDIPVDSIIANPNFPPQVFAGTDFGLYYTDDITANPPTWQRFNNGLPNVMIWDMQIDRGATTLSLWTRSRGAYAWPLPTGPETPLPTALSVSPASGTYGGTVNLTATLISGGNPVPDKTIAFTLNGNSAGSAVTDGSGTATLTGATLAGINAGSYPTGVAASFVTDGVYAGAADSEALTVARQAITVTAVADSKTYDGNTSSAASPAIVPDLAGSDTSAFIETFDTRVVATNKTLTPSGSVNDGNHGDNYNVTFVNNTAGVIIAKALTGTITADNKIYDGNTSATIAARSLSGVITPDVVSYTGGTATFASKTAENDKLVTATGLSLTGDDAGNYSVNSTATATASITQRALTISATGINKLYDATAIATVTLSDDRVAGDVFTDSYTTALFADAAAGLDKPVSVSGISISGPDAANYTFNVTAITKASIGMRLLTVSATGVNKEYDGTTAATVVLSDNRIPGDVFTTSYAGAAFTDKNVGTWSVNVSGISIAGPNAGDYAFNTIASTTAQITKAPLTVTANNSARLYSYPNPTFTASYSGFKNGETLATSGVTGAPSFTVTATPFSAAGTYTITVALGTLASNNYSFNFVNGTLTVFVTGIVGLDSVTIGSQKAVADSFDSTGGYDATRGANLTILSNGAIDIKGAKVSGNVFSSRGSVLLEPGSTVSGNVTAGTTITNQGTIGGTSSAGQLSALIVANPVADCGAFSINPGNWLSGAYTYSNGDLSVSGNKTVTLANGTYCFHNMTLSGNATLNVSGPVVIMMTGQLNASGGSFANTTLVASNLQIASSYAGTAGVIVTGNTMSYLTLFAPTTDVTITGGSPFFGGVFARSLTVSGNSQVHYDTLLQNVWSAFFGF